MNDSQQAGADVARAMGLDPHGMVELNLKFRSGDLLVVDTQQLVIGDRLKKVADEIVKRKFVFQEIKDEEAAPVAVPANERHDAATCCGERQEPDVGDGWRIVEPGEILLEGDETTLRDGEWVKVHRLSFGRQLENTSFNYRRRVTPDVPPAPQSRPAETRASRIAWDTPEEELAWFKKRVKWLDSEVERLEDDNKRLTAQVERLRLRPEEVDVVKKAIWEFDDAGGQVCQQTSDTLRDMLKRLGGVI